MYPCEKGGKCGEGLTCVADYCVPRSPDAGTPDAGTPDAGKSDAGAPDGCTQITCAQAGADCGPISNGCGTVIQCGACTGPKTCGGGPDGGAQNVCGCTPLTPAAVCAIAGRNCGDLMASNGCGANAFYTCGGACPADGGVCAAETGPELCAKASYACGTLGIKDRCGVNRLVQCGTCSVGNTCRIEDPPHDAGSSSACVVCVPEGDAAFCDRQGANCGALVANDNCGSPRTVVCGADPCVFPLDDGGTRQDACGISGGHIANQCSCQPNLAGCQVNAQCCSGTCANGQLCCVGLGGTCNDDAECCGSAVCSGRADGGAACAP